MSSLTYNPNIDISPYHIQEQPNIGSMNFPNDNYNYQPEIPTQYKQSSRQQQSQSIQYNPRIENIDERPIKKLDNTELFAVDNNKFNWILFIKKLVIYSMLFLIMSHVLMNNMVCHFIPYLNNNEIYCMVVKSVIMAILIIIIQYIL